MAQASDNVMIRSFRGKNGEGEHFLTITAPGTLELKEQIRHLETHYAEAIRSLGLAPETAVFRRVFLSDAFNQAEIVRRSELAQESDDNPVAVSIIQQPPFPYAKIALLAYHIESVKPLAKERIAPRHVLIRKNGLGHLWSTRLCTHDTDKAFSSATQTRSVFKDLIEVLSRKGGGLRDNCVRTWLYIKGIDMFYQGMVDARRTLFLQQGLMDDTHYIASTGIEGSGAHRHDLVTMDAYSILGHDPKQISYLNDFERLCATKDYNVTFERGTRIAYADRAQAFISGTASIDNQGIVLFPGDVLRQLDRALENVDALLRTGGACLADMMYLIVYLRDPADYTPVKAYLSRSLSTVPSVIVQGAVCRQEWLIEVEGVAIALNDQPSCPSF